MKISLEIILLAFIFLQLGLTVLLLLFLTKSRTEMRDSFAFPPAPEDNAFDRHCRSFFLTNREIEILKLLRDGSPYKIIADKLNISENTVATHIKNMFAKVGATNKMELVGKLMKGG
jgi:DNA-binding NarL/FixJ family response regulator